MKPIYRSLFLATIVSIIFSNTLCSQNTEKIQSFQGGEKLKFRLHYGFVTGGYATLEIIDKRYSSEDVFHIVGKGWSVGMFNWFFKVRDLYETYLKKEDDMPLFFNRDIHEGGYEKKRQIKFDREKNKAYTENKEFAVPDSVQDMLSVYYFLRNQPVEEMQIGDELLVSIFMDLEVFGMKLRFLGKEELKTKFGKLRCMKFRPLVQSDRIFKEQESLTVWVSDDKNRIPILLKAEVLVGSIKMELIEYSGLKYPIHFSN